jgi:hypothetical protein
MSEEKMIEERSVTSVPSPFGLIILSIMFLCVNKEAGEETAKRCIPGSIMARSWVHPGSVLARSWVGPGPENTKKTGEFVLF